MVIERNKLMACSEEFEKWFKERFTDKLNQIVIYLEL